MPIVFSRAESKPPSFPSAHLLSSDLMSGSLAEVWNTQPVTGVSCCRGSTWDIYTTGISQDSAWLSYLSSQFQLSSQHCSTPQFYDLKTKFKKRHQTVNFSEGAVSGKNNSCYWFWLFGILGILEIALKGKYDPEVEVCSTSPQPQVLDKCSYTLPVIIIYRGVYTALSSEKSHITPLGMPGSGEVPGRSSFSLCVLTAERWKLFNRTYALWPLLPSQLWLPFLFLFF